MVEFLPFGVSKTAQDIITEHLNTPKTPSTDVFRNPNFDLRTEQGLPSDALYPNPLLDTTPPTDAPVDPCPPGYMLVDGICQPIEQFGQSSYQQDNDRDDPEERKYMSIEDMKNASDEELLEYMTSGFLKNSPLGYLPSKGTEVTLSNMFMPSQFQLLFGKQNEMRKNFIVNELKRRGYYTGMNDGQSTFNLDPSLKQQNYENLLQEETGQTLDQATQNIINTQQELSQNIANDNNYNYYTPTKPVDTSGSGIVINQDGTVDQQSYQNALQQNIINSLQSETSNYSPSLGGFTGGR
jgi:hypothetical protein